MVGETEQPRPLPKLFDLILNTLDGVATILHEHQECCVTFRQIVAFTPCVHKSISSNIIK